jgi:hypothetical protein
MDTLKTPNDDFDFSGLVLNSPISLNGGNHFIKYKLLDEPLYIQAPKCTLRQGIIKASKRMFCDLMFTNNDAVFISWIERLETFSQKKIFENREKWFETQLEEGDIENSFTPSMKIYKSGKYYILRVSIPTLLGNSILKIYDEDENIVKVEDIKENDTVLTALEFQGVKCSPRSFQIEIELKQMLILKQNDIFEKCILNGKNDLVKNKMESVEEEQEVVEEPVEVEQSEEPLLEEVEKSEEVEQPLEQEVLEEVEEPLEVEQSEEQVLEEVEESKEIIEEPVKEVEEVKEIVQEYEIKNLDPVEFEIDLEKLQPEVINLKKKSDVYYEMYREALKRAKAAKDLALSGFLEAKRIKNTYMLEDIDDIDDSDIEEDSSDE